MYMNFPGALIVSKKICQKQQSVVFCCPCCTHGISRGSFAWTQTDHVNSKDNLYNIKQTMSSTLEELCFVSHTMTTLGLCSVNYRNFLDQNSDVGTSARHNFLHTCPFL